MVWWVVFAALGAMDMAAIIALHVLIWTYGLIRVLPGELYIPSVFETVRSMLVSVAGVLVSVGGVMFNAWVWKGCPELLGLTKIMLMAASAFSVELLLQPWARPRLPYIYGTPASAQ